METVKFIDAVGIEGKVEVKITNIDTNSIVIDGIEKETYTYDGIGVIPTTKDTDVKSVKLTKDEVEVEGYELGTAIVNVGSYKLEVTDLAGNDTIVEFIIEKAKLVVDVKLPENLVYDGNKKTINATVTNNDNTEDYDIEVLYYYKNEQGSYKGPYTNYEIINANDYRIKVTAKSKNSNYADSETVKVDFTVEKATPTIEFEVSEMIYNGQPQSPKVKVIGVNGELEVEESKIYKLYKIKPSTHLDGAPVNAGTYNLSFTFKGDENYNKAQANKDFTIKKATPTIEFEVSEMIYNGQKQSPIVRVIGVDGELETEAKDFHVLYKIKPSTEFKEAPVNAGNYNISIVYYGNENYNRVYANTDFKILKATPIVEFDNKEMVYNGQKQTPIVRVIGVDGELETEAKDFHVLYKIKPSTEFKEAPVNAGRYNISIVYYGNENYNRVYANTDFVIEKAQVTISTVTEENMIYDGTAKDVRFKFTDKFGEEVNYIENVPTLKAMREFREEPTSEFIKAGTYVMYISFDNSLSNNYEFTNFSEGAYYIDTFTIEKAEANIELIAPTSLIWDGTQKVYSVKESEISNNVTLTYYKVTESGDVELTEAPVNAGNYKVVAKLENNENYNDGEVTEEFIIEKAQVTMTMLLPEEGMSYTGNEKEITFKFTNNDGNDVEGINVSYMARYNGGWTFEIKDVGIYQLWLSINAKETENYNVINYSDILTVEVTKGITTVELVEPANGLTYDGTPKNYTVKNSPISDLVSLKYYEIKEYQEGENRVPRLVELSNAPINVNQHGYRVEAVFEGTEGFEPITVYEDFVIEPKTYDAEIVTSDSSCTYTEKEGYVCVYNGSSKVFTLKSTINGEIIELEHMIIYSPSEGGRLFSAPSAVGTYRINYFILAGDDSYNYQISETSKNSVNLTIVESN